MCACVKNFLYFLCFLLPCSCEKAQSDRGNYLLVGLQVGYPPFEYMNKEGRVVGFDLDVAKRVAEELGKTLVIKEMDFDGEILALKQGALDLIISGMDITPSRLNEISMVLYHGVASQELTFLFWGAIPSDIHSFQDVLDRSSSLISVESGSNSEHFLRRYPKLQTKSFQGVLQSLMDVKFGKSLAVLVEPDVAHYLTKKHEGFTCLSVPLKGEEAPLGFGIGVKKENEELRRKVSGIIEKMRVTKELQTLETKWFYEVEHDK